MLSAVFPLLLPLLCLRRVILCPRLFVLFPFVSFTRFFIYHTSFFRLTRTLFLLSHIRLALTGLDTIASVSENICDVKLRNGDLELISF